MAETENGAADAALNEDTEIAEAAGESVEEAAEVAGKSVAAGLVKEAEAAALNLKYVKRSLRRLGELSDIEKAELGDAMEEVLAQYGKIQPLYKSTKERLLAVAKALGACLAALALVAGGVQFSL